MNDILYASLTVLYFKIYQYEKLDCEADYSDIQAYITKQLFELEREESVQRKYWHKSFDVVFEKSKIPLRVIQNGSNHYMSVQFKNDLKILSEMDPKFTAFMR
ncbi:hypothetical protein [Fusibacter sp. 3D3]|uniref:hypothetical protein n=1 Tax=Fusibacter sp. 3D3 TaxID=1048380 RepID=UPI000852A402|nr:hypothetical protein [Fusibacter sp. 3D3]GAU75915.1 hypothetical protein F3D3_0511 [Fusibacter sp. 3D3]